MFKNNVDAIVRTLNVAEVERATKIRANLENIVA